MSVDRLKQRIQSVGRFQTVLACVFSLLLVTSGGLVFVTSAQESPDGVDDGATFTVRTGGIYPSAEDGGQICAKKIESDVNKVTVTNSTLKDVDIYLGKEGSVESHVSFPSGDVNGQLVLYTNGGNPLVNTLATLGICLPSGVPNPLPTTLKAYWLGVDNLETEGLSISSGGDPPSVSGPQLSDVLAETNTSKAELGINNSTDTNGGTETPNGTLGNGTNATNRTLSNATNGALGNNTNATNGTLNNTTTGTLNNVTNATNGAPDAQANETTAAPETESSEISRQGTVVQAESPPTTKITGHDRTDRNASEPDKSRTGTVTPESPPVSTGTAQPITTDEEDDDPLSGVLGPVFG